MNSPGPPPPDSTALALGAGRSLEVARSGEGASVVVRSPSGASELAIEIRMSPEGPVLNVRAAALELDAARAIRARCDEFLVEAQQRIELRAKGDLVARADGNVSLDGEFVLLNCDPVRPPSGKP